MPARSPRRTLSLLLALAAAPGCAPPRPAAAGAPVATPVRAAPVERGAVPAPVRAAGSLHPKDERALSFKVGGVLAAVRVAAGERVRRGQVLAELDATELLAGVRQAREGLQKAERDQARARALAAEEVAPRAAAEDAETAARVARAGAAAAEFNLERAVLRAPDDGWVEERLAEPGEVVAPGRPVLVVSGRARGLVVRLSLPDRDVLGLAPGQPARVTVDARPEAPLVGEVSQIARSASRATGTYEVEVRLTGPAGQAGPAAPARWDELPGGLSVKVEIARALPAAAAVPLAAVVDGDGERGAVFAPEQGRARRVPVRIAFLQGDRAVLAEDPAGLGQVITDGAGLIADGAPVRLVP